MAERRGKEVALGERRDTDKVCHRARASTMNKKVKKRTIKTTHRLPQSEIGGLPRLSLLTQDLGGLV
jgi:hypothetical protein